MTVGLSPRARMYSTAAVLNLVWPACLFCFEQSKCVYVCVCVCVCVCLTMGDRPPSRTHAFVPDKTRGASRTGP